MTDDEKNTEPVALGVSFLVTVGTMLVVMIVALCVQEWLIAAIAAFFAVLLWGFTIEDVRRIYAHESDDAARKTYQA
jgi:hypothetical protein